MTPTFLAELERLKAAATDREGNAELAMFLINHADAIAELVRAVQEVIRISDRKHDAWDAAKAALDKLNGGEG